MTNLLGQESLSTVDTSPSTAARERRVTLIRRLAITLWVVAVAYRTATTGLAFDRGLLILYIATGLAAASIGRRKVLLVVRDWLPFAVVLVAYDLSRGAATLVGAPTLWHPQVEADKWLFFGVVPTVWLQEHLKLPEPPWWEVIVSTVYMSFFILPYAVAGLLWLRDREEWKAFARRFVALSFAALTMYVAVPAAPPWAAAQCTPDEVVGGPSNPACIFRHPAGVPDGGLLGAMKVTQPDANAFVERISTRGWGTLKLDSAKALIDAGQSSVNLVAAIPSLHAGISAMVALFLWRRVRRLSRIFLAAYVVVMAFALVYAAEHYVIDILLGWALAVVVLFIVGRYEAWRSGDAPPSMPPEPANVSEEAEIPSAHGTHSRAIAADSR